MIIDFLAGYARICSPVFLCPAVSIKKQRTVFFKTIRCFFYFSYISFNISLMIVVIRGSAAAAAF